MDYNQPGFYHFSDDSIALVKAIEKNEIQIKESKVSLLDLCAGCGVISIEASLSLKEIKDIVFVEIQEEYNSFIQENMKKFLKDKVNYQIKNLALSQYTSDEPFDLIVCNPPYFIKGEGRISPNRNKQLCRTFEFDSPQDIIDTMAKNLKENGRGYLLVPKGVKAWESVINKYEKASLLKSLERAEIYLILKSNTDK